MYMVVVSRFLSLWLSIYIRMCVFTYGCISMGMFRGWRDRTIGRFSGQSTNAPLTCKCLDAARLFSYLADMANILYNVRCQTPEKRDEIKRNFAELRVKHPEKKDSDILRLALEKLNAEQQPVTA